MSCSRSRAITSRHGRPASTGRLQTASCECYAARPLGQDGRPEVAICPSSAPVIALALSPPRSNGAAARRQRRPSDRRRRRHTGAWTTAQAAATPETPAPPGAAGEGHTAAGSSTSSRSPGTARGDAQHSVAPDTSKVEDQVRGTLSSPIVLHGVTAVPAGAEVVGTVRDAKRSGVKGRLDCASSTDRRVHKEPLAIHTAAVSRQAKAVSAMSRAARSAVARARSSADRWRGKGPRSGQVSAAPAPCSRRARRGAAAAGTTVHTIQQPPVLVPAERTLREPRSRPRQSLQCPLTSAPLGLG